MSKQLSDFAPPFTLIGLYETRNSMFAGPRILWDDDQGESSKEEGEADATKDSADSKDEDSTSDDEDNEEVSEKDNELTKHLKGKVNRVNRQNKNLRDAKKDLTARLSKTQSDLGKVTKERDELKTQLEGAKKATTEAEIKSQLSKAGVSDTAMEDALTALEKNSSFFKEEEKDGKKVRSIDVDKFREAKPHFFGSSANQRENAKKSKTWVAQGGTSSTSTSTKKDDAASSPAASLIQQFNGPQSKRFKKE